MTFLPRSPHRRPGPGRSFQRRFPEKVEKTRETMIRSMCASNQSTWRRAFDAPPIQVDVQLDPHSRVSY